MNDEQRKALLNTFIIHDEVAVEVPTEEVEAFRARRVQQIEDELAIAAGLLKLSSMPEVDAALDLSWYSKRRDVKWLLGEGVLFCREVSAVVLPYGYYVALAGGVLINGHSSKDLDILLIPLDSSKHNDDTLARVKMALTAWGMKVVFDRAFVQERWRTAGRTDGKHVEIWRAPLKWGLLRVDIIFVQ